METPEQVCGEPKSEFCTMSAVELAELVRTGQASPVEIVEASLARIEEVQPVLNPFCFVYAEEALEQARKAEAAVAGGGDIGPLHGVPIAIKDFTPTKGKRTTRGSYAFENWVPDTDPVIVRRLLGAGAILVGKTTTPEFAYSGFTRSRLWGDTLNPWDDTRTTGGSSGGSGAAVASGCVALAEGTDMGGSVRIPASHCGTVGHKPSLGRIPMDILPTVFDNISHFGPLARTVDDAALFMSVAEGPDDADIQSQLAPAPIPMPVPCDVRGLRVAMSDDLGFFAVDDDVVSNLHRTADRLRQAGATVDPVALDWGPEIIAAWDAIWEVMLAAAFGDCLDTYRDRMDPDVVELIDAGLRRDAVSYRRLDDVRTRQWHELARVFAGYDALLCPTMAIPAPQAHLRDADLSGRDADGKHRGHDMTMPFNNVSQCPALSVPSGFTRDGLPTGAQIVGHRFDDPTVFRVGAAILAC